MRCLLCGHDFDPAGLGCKPGCPLAKGCNIVCCPRCGHSSPRETGLAGLLRRALVKLERRR